jgi:HlyD family secretion protein
VTYALSKLEPAAPSVERSAVFIDTVKRGPMLVDVRGIGTLVPQDIVQIPARDEGRVEQRLCGMQAPVSTLAGLLAAPLRNLGYALAQVAEQKRTESPEA